MNQILKFSLITFAIMMFIGQGYYLGTTFDEHVIVEEGTMIVRPYVEPDQSDPEQVLKLEMKMNIESIMELVKNNPDLLTDDEVDILLSIAVGRGHGFTDPEVDAKGEKIMWKIAGQVKKIES